MKPSNPMEQLKKWKAMNTKNLVSGNETKNGLVKKANLPKIRENSKNKTKPRINPLAFKYSQLTRQFQLIQDSNKRCLEVYPDDFHHKVKFRDEIADLVNKLAGGGNLLNTLAKTGNLSRENADKLKDFNQANRYLIHKFSEVVEQISALNAERTEQQKGSK